MDSLLCLIDLLLVRLLVVNGLMKSGANCNAIEDLTYLFDQGNSLYEYRKATGHREKSAIESFPSIPKQLAMLYGPGLYQPTFAKRLDAVQTYLRLLDILLPTDQALTSGHLWHNDLHGENIFVSHENPTQVIGIIDWQSIQIAPLFDHCMDPVFLDYCGPPIGDSLKRPELPDDIQSLPMHERDAIIRQFMDKSVMVAWRMLVKKKNPAQYSAIMFEYTTEGSILHLSHHLYEIGEAYVSALSLDLYRQYLERPAGDANRYNFPLAFSVGKALEIESERAAAQLSSEAMRSIRHELGGLWPDKGLIEHDNYEELKSKLLRVKEELTAKLAHSDRERDIFEQFWPFDS
ncbi:hypothetical protein PRK78_004264 [Emydomyces testavorans]|uniref:Altered inheritance of mitochondria protein 9, mitochondrial n=1 Tax=Emydomyces testavorans TaxID=2070801 RepID=A0AAF0IJL6_9EURO|nr:hypothetical protein PRK78_004264 [Emydomyces testavorans]